MLYTRDIKMAASKNVHVGIVNIDNWEDILRQNFVELSKIRPLYLVDVLYQRCVLSDIDKDEILSKSPRRQQATHLLELLPSKGYQNFVTFLAVLELEYPHIYETVTTVTAKERPPGYKRTDRCSIFLEQMPQILEKLRLEMQHSQHLQGTLEQLKITVDIMEREKVELENELDECKQQLEDLPQLRKALETFDRDNQELTRQRADNAQRCLEYIKEKENVEKTCHHLQTKTNDLEKQVQKLRLERDQERRRTRRLERQRLDQQGPSFDTPIDHPPLGPVQDDVIPETPHVDVQRDILQDQLKEASEQNDELAQKLTDTRVTLHQLEEDHRQVRRERNQLTETLKNVQENHDNYKSRCDERWEQIDQLREEKRKAIEQRELLQKMYDQVSAERDRLSSQKQKLETQYDNTKHELDKLKQQMRTSLTCDGENISSSINQWINQLEKSKYLLATSSSSGISDGNDSPVSPYLLDPGPKPFLGAESASTLPAFSSRDPLLKPSEKPNVFIRSTTLLTNLDSSDLRDNKLEVDHDRDIADARRVINKTPNLQRYQRKAVDEKDVHVDSTPRKAVDEKDVDSTPRCQSSIYPVYDSADPVCNSVSPSSQVTRPDPAGPCSSHFYVRCNQDCNRANKEEILYKEGDIYLITDCNYKKKKDTWFAKKVDENTGNLIPRDCRSDLITEGILSRQDKPDVPIKPAGHHRLSPQNSANVRSGEIPRRPAMKRMKSQDKDTGPFSVVVPKQVESMRPVMMFGRSDVIRSIAAMLENHHKYHSWFTESIVDSAEKSNYLEKADKHIILPCGNSSTLSNLVSTKVFPICVVIKLADSAQPNRHLTTLFGQLEDVDITKNQISKDIADIKLVGLNCEVFTISQTHTPTSVELQQKLLNKIQQMQSHVVWVSREKPTSP